MLLDMNLDCTLSCCKAFAVPVFALLSPASLSKEVKCWIKLGP